MITRIVLEGYKSIRSLDLELGPINILLGGNGVGKSNLISLFSLIRNIHNQNLQGYVRKKGGPDSLLHFGRKHTSEIAIHLYFEGDEGGINRFALNLEAGQGNLYIAKTETSFKAVNGWHPRVWENNVEESRFAKINRSQAYWVNQRLEEFDVYHFHDTGDSSPMKRITDLHDNHSLKPDGSNLAAFLYLLQEKHPKHFLRIEKTVQSIAPFFDRFELQPDRINERQIQLEWREKGAPDAYFNAYHLSDGTLRFIALCTLLMQPHPPATIIIDEPELGLHPVAINKLAALVRKASAHTQVILSTQSVNLIDNFSPEDIVVADRTKEGSVFERLSTEELAQWLEEYTLGDLWGKNILGAQPYSV